MIKKYLSKPGDSHTAECGCVIQFGDHETKRSTNTVWHNPTNRPIYDVIVKKCKRCETYTTERNKLIDEAVESAKADLAACRADNVAVAFLGHMDRLAAERGI